METCWPGNKDLASDWPVHVIRRVIDGEKFGRKEDVDKSGVRMLRLGNRVETSGVNRTYNDFDNFDSFVYCCSDRCFDLRLPTRRPLSPGCGCLIK